MFDAVGPIVTKLPIYCFKAAHEATSLLGAVPDDQLVGEVHVT